MLPTTFKYSSAPWAHLHPMFIIWQLPLHFSFESATNFHHSKQEVPALNDVMHEKMCMWLTILSINIDVVHLSLMFHIKFDVKVSKMEQNHMDNLNMNVLGIVWQIIHYFTGKLNRVSISIFHDQLSNPNCTSGKDVYILATDTYLSLVDSPGPSVVLCVHYQ